MRKNKLTYNNMFLQEFCETNNIILLNDYSIENINRDSIIKGKCKSDNCNEICSKRFRQFINTNCYCIYHTKENLKEKREETILKKYGVKNAFQSNIIKQKIENSMVNIYGVKNISQSEEIKDKKVETSLRNYGVKHPHQNPIIAEKASKNSYRTKLFTFPSGKQIKIQGYENYALDELLQNDVLEENIMTGCKNVPEIWYEDESGKKHRHFVDIFIQSQNKCIEIKSTWTAEKKKDCIFLKQQAGKDLGYNYEIWVYDGKGEKVGYYK